MEAIERKISVLFKNLCCSQCKSDFDENSVIIMRKENSDDETMLVAKLVCNNCGKSFGLAFLGLADLDLKEEVKDEDFELRMFNDAPPISADDVIDAHDFIKNLEGDWNKYLK